MSLTLTESLQKLKKKLGFTHSTPAASLADALEMSFSMSWI